MATTDPLWKQVRVPVLSGILLFSFAAIWTEPVRAFIGNCWSALFNDVAMPLWLSLLLWLSLALVIFTICTGLVKWLLEKGKGPFAEYKSDVFFGIKWCWGFSLENHISDLRPLCLSCDRIARAYQGNELYQVNPVDISCEPCNLRIRFPHDFDELKHKVKLEIEHRIRTGIWKDVIQNHLQKK